MQNILYNKSLELSLCITAAPERGAHYTHRSSTRTFDGPKSGGGEMMYGKTRKRLVACISSVIHREEGFQDYRFVVKTVLESFDIDAVRNYEDVRNQTNFNLVLEEECDLFVLLLGNVVSKAVAKELNIALARGLPIFVFIKRGWDTDGKLVDSVAAKELLLKNCPGLYEEDRIYFDSAESLASHVKYQTAQFVRRKLLISPIVGIDPPVAYTEGIHLIQHARYRVVLVQRTSTFLLGPRIGNDPESRFYESLMRWLETKGKRRVFLHYFSWGDTQKALQSREYDVDVARKKATKLIQRKRALGLQMTFRASPEMDIVSHVVGDTGLGLNFWIGESRYYLFLPSFMTKEKELEKIIASVQGTGKLLTRPKLLGIYAGKKL